MCVRAIILHQHLSVPPFSKGSEVSSSAADQIVENSVYFQELRGPQRYRKPAAPGPRRRSYNLAAFVCLKQSAKMLFFLKYPTLPIKSCSDSDLKNI